MSYPYAGKLIQPLQSETIFAPMVTEQWLVTSGCSAAAFEACYPELLKQANELPVCDRFEWLQGLRRLWTAQGLKLTVDGREALLMLAFEWQDWPLVEAVCAYLDQVGLMTERQLLLWAETLFHLGSKRALQLVQRYLFTCPRCPQGEQLYRQIASQEEWLTQRGLQQLPQDKSLLLVPLQHHHRDAFLRQYDHPDIAAFCCLPVFEEAEQWHGWLDQSYSYGDQVPFAIIHKEWGLTGVVSLTLSDGVGFVYYWLGSNFRGCGLAPQAVSLLLTHAHENWGLTCCYAKLFDFNTASRRVLEKAGFVDLDIRAQAPDERELFYRLGAQQSRQESVHELYQFLNRVDSETKISAVVLD